MQREPLFVLIIIALKLVMKFKSNDNFLCVIISNAIFFYYYFTEMIFPTKGEWYQHRVTRHLHRKSKSSRFARMKAWYDTLEDVKLNERVLDLSMPKNIVERDKNIEARTTASTSQIKLPLKKRKICPPMICEDKENNFAQCNIETDKNKDIPSTSNNVVNCSSCISPVNF